MKPNLNKTKALVVSRSRTVNTPHGDLVLPGVSIYTSPNLDILGMKFDNKLTFKDHVYYNVLCLSKNYYFEVGEVCLWGHLCVTSLQLCICSPNPSVHCVKQQNAGCQIIIIIRANSRFYNLSPRDLLD